MHGVATGLEIQLIVLDRGHMPFGFVAPLEGCELVIVLPGFLSMEGLMELCFGLSLFSHRTIISTIWTTPRRICIDAS